MCIRDRTSADLEQLFADLAANISVPGATNIVINEALNPDFVIIMSTEQIPIFAAAIKSAKSAQTGAKGYAGFYADSTLQDVYKRQGEGAGHHCILDQTGQPKYAAEERPLLRSQQNGADDDRHMENGGLDEGQIDESDGRERQEKNDGREHGEQYKAIDMLSLIHI